MRPRIIRLHNSLQFWLTLYERNAITSHEWLNALPEITPEMAKVFVGGTQNVQVLLEHLKVSAKLLAPFDAYFRNEAAYGDVQFGRIAERSDDVVIKFLQLESELTVTSEEH